MLIRSFSHASPWVRKFSKYVLNSKDEMISISCTYLFSNPIHSPVLHTHPSPSLRERERWNLMIGVSLRFRHLTLELWDSKSTSHSNHSLYIKSSPQSACSLSLSPFSLYKMCVFCGHLFQFIINFPTELSIKGQKYLILLWLFP